MQSHERGPDHPEGENISTRLSEVGVQTLELRSAGAATAKRVYSELWRRGPRTTSFDPNARSNLMTTRTCSFGSPSFFRSECFLRSECSLSETGGASRGSGISDPRAVFGPLILWDYSYLYGYYYYYHYYLLLLLLFIWRVIIIGFIITMYCHSLVLLLIVRADSTR